MFLYDRKEVLGCNVKVLMAEPHKGQHDNYVKAYLTTKVKKVLGSSRMVEAKAKDGHLIPVWLSLTETTVNEEPAFVGSMKDLTHLQPKRYVETNVRNNNTKPISKNNAKILFC